MKNKKAQFFGIQAMIILGLTIMALILLIWFGFRISAGIVSVFDFLKTYWLYITLVIFGLLWHKQIGAVVNKILGHFGVKV
ncbi:MAG: hypothetical protein KKB88_02230 [Nanoarchaeota archaeon]|nr:hypothetical protein [Nanoarchaeota archaeon]